MAQRTGVKPTSAGSDMAGSCGSPAGSREPEEGQAIPARARYLRGDGAERTVVPPLILKTIGEHLHADGVATVLPFQNGAGPRDAAVQAGVHATGDPCGRRVAIEKVLG